MAVATIGHEKGNEPSNSLDVGAVDYRAAIPCAADKPGASENAQVRRQRIVRTSDRAGDRAGRKTSGFCANQKSKNLKASGLTECRKRRESVRRRHNAPTLLRSDMADHGQCGALHKTQAPICLADRITQVTNNKL